MMMMQNSGAVEEAINLPGLIPIDISGIYLNSFNIGE